MSDSAVAADQLIAELRLREGGPLLRALRVLGAVLGGAIQGLVPQPSLHDLVVTRRADGREVLRTPAGDPEAAVELLRDVRARMGRQSVDEFLESWGSTADRG